MFAIFIICAWSLTLVSATGLLLFGSMSLISMLTATNPIAFISKILEILTKSLFTPVYGPNLVINSSTKGASSSNQIALIIWIAISFSVAILLITISIIELLRLKKHQKISKPYIKVTMVILSIVLLLTGQLLLVLASILILLAFILLEAILFDSEALNNYAEERNLILIYKEEKKFEKEVSKQGKLVGSVELKNLQKDFQKENEKVKTEDNSALPNLIKNQLKENSFSEQEKLNIVDKFNSNVTKVNSIAKKLRMPKSYYISYINEKNKNNKNNSLSVITETDDNNVVDLQESIDISNESNKLKDNISQRSNLSSEIIILGTNAEENLEKSDVNSNQVVSFEKNVIEIKNQAKEELSLKINENTLTELSQSSEVRDKENNKLLSSQELVSNISKSENIVLDENLLIQKLARAVNMDLNQLTESKEPDADKNLIYSDFNFDQPDLVNQVLFKEVKENNKELENPISQIFSSVHSSINNKNNIDEQKKVLKNNEPVFGRIEEHETIKPIVEDSEVVSEKLNLIIETPSFVAKPTWLVKENMESTIKETINQNRSSQNLVEHNVIVKENSKPVLESSSLDEENKKINLVHNCNNDFQTEELKKYIFKKEEELLNRLETDINSFDLNKLNTIEERIFNLESLIESLGNKVFNNQVIQDFTRINKQLESISKVVNELENNTPKAVINNLTAKYNYNKNNG
ncbi:hypothetical protein [Spiroplasma endosymbiont of Atherix ibis]|uniref:hypothetical protein n=1 Tax=Spiroplasma endosymbiont of Atherix ibis TaxID=3066291 RepID=UPI0030D15F51